MAITAARRRYNRSALVLAIGYMLALFGVVSFFRNHPDASDGSAYIIAVLPALPILGVFFVLGRYLVEERDEYLKMLLVRQGLIATALTLSVATIWGFLENFGLVRHIAAYYAAVLWFGGLGLGSCVDKLTERPAP